MLVLCKKCDREYFLNDFHRCQMADADDFEQAERDKAAQMGQPGTMGRGGAGFYRSPASTSIFVTGLSRGKAPRHGDPRFYALLEEIGELHSRKSYDYTPEGDPLANFKRAEKLGVPAWKSCLIRMGDKQGRIEQLANGKDPQNESLRDSLIDNAVYSLLCILLLEDAKG